nr:exopolysaccharide biosynthesis polyprenyl glycosylphosphotransferase [Corynebacterium sp. TAE3-ERU12]
MFDVAGLLLSVAVVVLLRFLAPEHYAVAPSNDISLLSSLVLATAFVVLWLLVLRTREIFDDDVYRDRQMLSRRIFEATLITLCVPSVLAVALQWDFLRPFILVSVPIGFVLLIFNHLFLQPMVLKRIMGTSIGRQVLVCTRDQIREFCSPEWRNIREEMNVVAYLVIEDRDGDSVTLENPDGSVIVPGRAALTADTFIELGVDHVFVMCPGRIGQTWLRRMSWTFAPLGISVFLYPNLVAANPQRVRAARVGTMALMKIIRPGNIGANGFFKRIFDIVVAVLLVILLSPLLIITALAVKLGDGGPVFYRAPRLGKHGELFRMWKFRSMCVDADQKADALIKKHGDGSVLLFKMENDPRVTRVGKFIRRYSIDELPQLFNVIGGTMSLVGPRPPLEREIIEYDRDAWMRLTVLPGITGLWQVSGRSRLSAAEAISLDLLYIDNWTIGLDLSILARTFKAVLSSDGAY